MHWVKILIVVLGSVWFFPVGCTAGLFAGTRLASELDARDATRGDPVHSQFSIVSESRYDGEPFLVTRLSSLRRHEESAPPGSPTSSYLMSQPSGHRSDDSAEYSYIVLEETASEQVIEVVESYHDGDNTIWSRYKATRSTVIPISSRMFYFGYMFSALPFAIGFSLLLYLVSRYLKHRVYASNSKDDES